MSEMLRPVDGVEVIILVDNVVDMASTCRRPEVKRAWWPRDDEAEGAHNMPLAEHGFSALVRLWVDGERHAMLFDTGTSGHVALHNASAAHLDWDEIEAVALSHGHFDHTGGLLTVRPKIATRALPLIAHEDTFALRGSLDDQGHVRPAQPPLSKQGLSEQGMQLLLNREPLALFGNTLLVMGEVPRQTEFEGPHPTQMRREGTDWVPDPWISDDRGLVLSVRHEGLVVLTGCAHAGIVNTLLHAQSLGGGPLRAVIGGFHLSGPRFEPRIEPTVRAVEAMKPDLLLPLHCTGPRGVGAFMTAMPEATVYGGSLVRVRIGQV